MLGNKVINLDNKTDIGLIPVGDVEFNGAPGLCQLLVWKTPNCNKTD